MTKLLAISLKDFATIVNEKILLDIFQQITDFSTILQTKTKIVINASSSLSSLENRV